MPQTISNNKSSTIRGKNSTEKRASEDKKKNLNAHKKLGALNVKVPTAMERAKEFDEARRNDANSNEL